MRIRKIAVALMLMGVAPIAFGVVSTAAILKRLVVVIDKLEEAGQQVLFAQIDNITKGHKDTQTYTLQQGASYKIIVIGDQDRVADIDLQVLDENGSVVGKDDDSSNVAVVDVSPIRTASFKFQVWAASMNANDAFYSIVVSRNDGSGGSKKGGKGSAAEEEEE